MNKKATRPPSSKVSVRPSTTKPDRAAARAGASGVQTRTAKAQARQGQGQQPGAQHQAHGTLLQQEVQGKALNLPGPGIAVGAWEPMGQLLRQIPIAQQLHAIATLQGQGAQIHALVRQGECQGEHQLRCPQAASLQLPGAGQLQIKRLPALRLRGQRDILAATGNRLKQMLLADLNPQTDWPSPARLQPQAQIRWGSRQCAG